MATLQASGTEVLRMHTTGGHEDRFMSNGAILRKRPTGGGFIKIANCHAHDRTFGDILAVLSEAGCDIIPIDTAWLGLRPAPTKRMSNGTINPGLLRAKVEQGS